MREVTGGDAVKRKRSLIQLAGKEADSYIPDFESIGIDERWHRLLTRFMEQVYVKGYRAAQRDARKKVVR